MFIELLMNSSMYLFVISVYVSLMLSTSLGFGLWIRFDQDLLSFFVIFSFFSHFMNWSHLSFQVCCKNFPILCEQLWMHSFIRSGGINCFVISSNCCVILPPITRFVIFL